MYMQVDGNEPGGGQTGVGGEKGELLKFILEWTREGEI